MKIKKWLGIGVIPLLALGIWAFEFRGKADVKQLDYRYTDVVRGDVSQSIEATGSIVPLTQVDVKSKAGGIVTTLKVDVGSVVKEGDVIAIIDPRDTQATYDQAQADLSASNAKEGQALDTYKLQIKQSNDAIAAAQQALEAAKIQLQKVSIQTKQQPLLSAGNLDSAKAAYEGAVADYNKLVNVTIPQTESDTNGAVAQMKAQRDADEAQYTRDLDLIKKGFISQSQLDKDTAAYAQSKQNYSIANQKLKTLSADLQTSIRSQKAAVARTKAALEQAQASMTDVQVANDNYATAQQSVLAAKIALNTAIANKANVGIRKADVLTAQSDIVRSRVTSDNAKVQLDSTVVKAPRSGVVTLKYLEEGTIIPPGTSVFSQGTSLVQLSDVSQLFVDCTVDEADIGSVKVGQKVRVTMEAYKDTPVEGVVTRVNPAAVTASNVTTILARVKILPDPKRTIQLLPGMNASCQFITLDRPNVIMVPSQAIQEDAAGTYVMVETSDPKKPVRRAVTVGETGDDNVEVKSGLKVGEKVVTATIDIAEDKRIQQEMEQSTQGGLAGGGGQARKSYATTAKKKK